MQFVGRSGELERRGEKQSRGQGSRVYWGQGRIHCEVARLKEKEKGKQDVLLYTRTAFIACLESRCNWCSVFIRQSYCLESES